MSYSAKMIATIPGFILLLVTVVGIPLAGLVFLLLMLYTYLAKIVVAQPVGNWLLQKFNRKTSVYGSVAFGLLTIFIIRAIPVVGPLVGLFIFMLGLGALTLQTLSKLANPRF